ncbi:unnamed protein product (mitochondrion) [Plasmodiophora brassicae]|uniref:Uncharacterized protein n=1 Tax=Plasmodiophora brassicae TaxID=37360 RepID=A0A3P3YEP6_PLABS|nr:unnamed protein product [Plasmodiophora brassicae]
MNPFQARDRNGVATPIPGKMVQPSSVSNAKTPFLLNRHCLCRTSATPRGRKWSQNAASYGMCASACRKVRAAISWLVREKFIAKDISPHNSPKGRPATLYTTKLTREGALWEFLTVPLPEKSSFKDAIDNTGIDADHDVFRDGRSFDQVSADMATFNAVLLQDVTRKLRFPIMDDRFRLVSDIPDPWYISDGHASSMYLYGCV